MFFYADEALFQENVSKSLGVRYPEGYFPDCMKCIPNLCNNQSSNFALFKSILSFGIQEINSDSTV